MIQVNCLLLCFELNLNATSLEATMRLITHNMLRNNAKGVEGGYPLRLEVKSESGSITREESEFDAERVKCLLKKLNFGALKSAAKDLSMESELCLLYTSDAADE